MKHILIFSLVFSFCNTYAQNKKWSLKDCVNHALQNNISVKQSTNSLLINEQDVLQAKGQFLPALNTSLGQRLSIGSGFDPVTNQRINNQTTHSFNYNIGVNQTIFNGFRTLNLYKQSLLNLETSKLELNRIKDDIALNVVNAYLNVLFNKERLEMASNQYLFSKNQLNQITSLVEAGVQPKVNIYDAQATLSNDAQNVTLANNNYKLSLLSLSQLLQIKHNNFEIEILQVDTPSKTLLYNAVDPILNYALEHRNEIKIAEKNIENAALNVDVSKSGYYPTVTAGYGFGSVWSESKNDFIRQAFFRELDLNKGHNFNLNVNIPIFSRYQNKTSVARAKIRATNSALNLQQAKLNLESNIQLAFADAQAAFKTYQGAKKTLEAQELSFKNAQERYQLGAINTFDLDQSRVRFVNAQSALINAKYDFVFKTKILDFYIGKPLTR